MASDVMKVSEPMSGGAIAGVTLGLILLIAFFVLLIVWLIRCRKNWTGQKHTRMSAFADAKVSAGSDVQLCNFGQIQARPVDRTPWKYVAENNNNNNSAFHNPWYYEGKLAAIQPAEQSSLSNPVTWFDSTNPVITSSYVPATFSHNPLNQLQLGASRRNELECMPEVHDTVSASAYSSHLYPNLPIQPGTDEPKTSTTDSSGNQVTQKSSFAAHQRLRSHVKKVARASQFTLSNLRHRRLSKSSNLETKRFRSKRRNKRPSFPMSESSSGFGFSTGFDIPGTGYYNTTSNQSTPYTYDNDLGSLDNDNFLSRLEQAVLPGNIDKISTSCPSHASWRTRGPSRVRFNSQVLLPDRQQADLFNKPTSDSVVDSNNNTVSRFSYTPVRPMPAISPGFRFPSPGPPVSGWAHQFVQGKNTYKHRSVPDASPKCHSVPAIPPPPPSPSAKLTRQHFLNVKSATFSSDSSVAIPRNRPSRSFRSRQMSEPRQLSKSVRNSDSEKITSPSSLHDQARLQTSWLSTLASLADAERQATLVCGSLTMQVDSGYTDSLTGALLETPTVSCATTQQTPTFGNKPDENVGFKGVTRNVDTQR